jgi:hypothetical protein
MSKGLVATLAFCVIGTSWAAAQAQDFLTLVRTGTAQQVQAAIAAGADVKALDPNHENALHIAAQYNPR